MSDQQFQRAVTSSLAQFLAQAVPELEQVIPEWPSPNLTLKYPSLTVTTAGSIRLAIGMGYQASMGPIEDNQSDVKYIGGQFELRLQLDLWAQNKPQRSMIFEKVLRVLNPDPTIMGIRIQLNNYHQEWASYSATGYEIPDNAESSQRQEWRTIISVDVLCNAIFEKSEYIIGQVILTAEPTANYSEEF